MSIPSTRACTEKRNKAEPQISTDGHGSGSVERREVEGKRNPRTRLQVGGKVEYNTLQDFATFTKGICYVVMFILLVCFIPFWLYLTEREKKD